MRGNTEYPKPRRCGSLPSHSGFRPKHLCPDRLPRMFSAGRPASHGTMKVMRQRRQFICTTKRTFSRPSLRKDTVKVPFSIQMRSNSAGSPPMYPNSIPCYENKSGLTSESSVVVVCSHRFNPLLELAMSGNLAPVPVSHKTFC